jgi:hypothetical protein
MLHSVHTSTYMYICESLMRSMHTLLDECDLMCDQLLRCMMLPVDFEHNLLTESHVRNFAAHETSCSS